jgi:hypothetical protein
VPVMFSEHEKQTGPVNSAGESGCVAAGANSSSNPSNKELCDSCSES